MYSAGLVIFRNRPVEILLCRMGGPYFKSRPLWTIPKGTINQGETEREAALREFKEETGLNPPAAISHFVDIRMAKGKWCSVWLAPANTELQQIQGIVPTQSNTCTIEWPPKSGTFISIPETEEMGFFTLEEAAQIIPKSQQELLLQIHLRMEVAEADPAVATS